MKQESIVEIVSNGIKKITGGLSSPRSAKKGRQASVPTVPGA